MKKYSLSPCNVSWQKSITCHLGGCGCAENPFIWISHKLRCIYFEIPKTASTSIKTFLNDEKFEFSQLWETPEEVALRFEGYYRFAVIREPVQRMISNYKMFCLSDLDYRHRQIEALFGKGHAEVSLEEFVGLSTTYRNHHWEKIVRFLPAGAAVEPSRFLDKVIVMESFASGWREVESALGIVNPLPHHNSTRHVSHGAEVPQKTLQAIQELYLEDISLYKTVLRHYSGEPSNCTSSAT